MRKKGQFNHNQQSLHLIVIDVPSATASIMPLTATLGLVDGCESP